MSDFRALGKGPSRLMLRWYYGPDYPTKIRQWETVHALLGRPRFTIPYGQGWITVDLGDFVQRSVAETGAYEPEVWDRLASHVRSGDVLWDIGAHIGVVSLRAAKDTRLRAVVAFEAMPRHAELLRHHARLSSTTSLQIVDTALGNRSETVVVEAGPSGNSGMAAVRPTGGPNAGRDQVRVPCTTVDEVLRSGFPPPTLVKLDVEGWEFPVLEGARGLFAAAPPRCVVFEAEVDEALTIIQPGLADFFQTHGYAVEHIARPDGATDVRENFAATLLDTP